MEAVDLVDETLDVGKRVVVGRRWQPFSADLHVDFLLSLLLRLRVEDHGQDESHDGGNDL